MSALSSRELPPGAVSLAELIEGLVAAMRSVLAPELYEILQAELDVPLLPLNALDEVAPPARSAATVLVLTETISRADRGRLRTLRIRLRRDGAADVSLTRLGHGDAFAP